MPVELPSTPAGHEMAWVIGLLASGAMGLQPEEVDGHAAPSLLAEMTSEALAHRLQDLATQMGGMEIERVDEASPHSLSVRLIAYGYGWEVGIEVEPEPPHRLTRIDFGHWFAPPPGSRAIAWDGVAEDRSISEGGTGTLPFDMRASLVAERGRLRMIGLAAGVVKGSELVYSLALGPARLVPAEPVTERTLFMICSISKTMVTLGVLQLGERGLLRLDDPVNDYLFGLRIAHQDPSAPAVTIRHLLTHTSGAYAPVSLGFEMGATTPSLAELYGGTLACQFPPGSRWCYSDHGFSALGQLVSDVSGRPFAEYMRENLFVPLGMEHTQYEERYDDPELAVGYGGADGQVWEDRRFQAGPLAPAGSVTSDTRDMAKYVRALVNGGANEHGRVVAAETLQAALTPQVALPMPGTSAGLGFAVTEIEGHRVAWHNGGWPGYSSTMWFAPDDGWGVTLLTNTSDVTGRADGLDKFAKGLLAMLLAS